MALEIGEHVGPHIEQDHAALGAPPRHSSVDTRRGGEAADSSSGSSSSAPWCSRIPRLPATSVSRSAPSGRSRPHWRMCRPPCATASPAGRRPDRPTSTRGRPGSQMRHGHIPGAVNHYWQDDLTQEGFRPHLEAGPEPFLRQMVLIVVRGTGMWPCRSLRAGLPRAGRAVWRRKGSATSGSRPTDCGGARTPLTGHRPRTGHHRLLQQRHRGEPRVLQGAPATCSAIPGSGSMWGRGPSGRKENAALPSGGGRAIGGKDDRAT